MKTKNKTIKIVVLDDNSFYNKLLAKQIDEYTERMKSDNKDYNFEIEAYAHADDFLRNLKKDTNIAFVDYFLGQGITGREIIAEIEKRCDNCKIIIVSKSREAQKVVDTVSRGATAFIYKDKYALKRACFFVDHIANNQLNL